MSPVSAPVVSKVAVVSEKLLPEQGVEAKEASDVSQPPESDGPDVGAPPVPLNSSLTAPTPLSAEDEAGDPNEKLGLLEAEASH